MALPKITDEHVLEAIVELGGDGYWPVQEVFAELPRRTHADRRRAVYRAVNRGLVLERRGPDGRIWVALSSEGWRLLRSQAA
jgi:hypothetical protein